MKFRDGDFSRHYEPNCKIARIVMMRTKGVIARIALQFVGINKIKVAKFYEVVPISSLRSSLGLW